MIETRIEIAPLRLSPILQRPTSIFRQVLTTTVTLAETDAKKLQSGPVLKTQTGALSSRTHGRLEESPGEFRMVLANPQVYSRILELGGRTRPHIIRPKTEGGVLAFERGGETVFARFVNHPGSVIRPHPTLRPALEGQVAQLPERLARAIEAHG